MSGSSHSMIQFDATELFEKYKAQGFSEYHLSSKWTHLEQLPPKIEAGTASFAPENSFRFLEDLARGKKVSEVLNMSAYGITEKTHLNVLGRIAAAKKLFSKDKATQARTLNWSGIVNDEFDEYRDGLQTFVDQLENFENDFSDFIETHRDLITEELKERREHPHGITADVPAEELWQIGGQSEEAIRTACFSSFNDADELVFLREPEKKAAPTVEPEKPAEPKKVSKAEKAENVETAVQAPERRAGLLSRVGRKLREYGR